MNYYTSDLHLGHFNIIRFCNRPFKDTEEMDNALISNWNARITNRDDVYIVGDLMYRISQDPASYLDKLKGKKHLIFGNHDSAWMKKVDLSKYFESVDRMSVINTGKCKVTLCHYPMMNFEGKFMVYGHLHNNKNDTYWKLLSTMENALNACVEVNGYQPVTFEELTTNNRIFREG